MEGDIKLDAGRMMIKGPTPAGVKLLDQPNSMKVVSPVKQMKLPPLGGGGISSHDTAGSRLLEQSKNDVQESMKHLLIEAQSVESQIQRSMEILWQRMQDMIEENNTAAQQQVKHLKQELNEAQCKLSHCISTESNLVQQNAMTSMQLTIEEKKRKELESVIGQLKEKLKQHEVELNNVKNHFKEKEKVQNEEQEKLKAQLEEKTKALKEYQVKISKLTDKMNCLSKDLTNEKSTIERSKKQTSEQLSHQTSEIRKLTLEISKLKAQLSSSTAAVATIKEEKRKLEILLKSQQQDHEMTLTRIKQTHEKTVKELENQIALLTKEIEALKFRHKSEIELLKKQLSDTEQALMELYSSTSSNNDDYLEARIKFLRHQNIQEKIKLQKDSVKI